MRDLTRRDAFLSGDDDERVSAQERKLLLILTHLIASFNLDGHLDSSSLASRPIHWRTVVDWLL